MKTLRAKEGSVRSTDGTTIAFERAGAGPALVLVDPAGGYRGFDNIRGLGKLLETEFTVYTYDRRGRGASGDTAPYAIEREVEDLSAVISEAGGKAFVYGFSSGALLTVLAAASRIAIDKMVLLEPPIGSEDHLLDPDIATQIAELVAADRREDATGLWLTAIGVPDDILAQMEPVRPALEAVAHTLVYDCMIAEATTIELLRSVTTPALLLHSDASSGALVEGARAASAALPNGECQSVVGEWHGVPDEALAPVLSRYFLAKASRYDSAIWRSRVSGQAFTR